MTWRADALCTQVDVGDMFFPEKGGSTQPAKRICATCTVREECLRDALATERPGERHGVRGGATPSERAKLAGRPRCAICEGPMPDRKSGRRYCSPTCRQAAHRAQKRAHNRQAPRRVA